MRESIWNGFRRIDFEFENRKAILIFPDNANNNKNWMIKTEYFGDFPKLEIDLIKRGWHLAFVKNVSRWCLEEDLDLKKWFADFLISNYDLNKKCVPIGISFGGLISTKFTAKYPEYIQALYLDAPVMNFLSYPFPLGKAENSQSVKDEFTNDTKMTEVDLINYREHPIDKKEILLKNNISIVMVYGDVDKVVPYDENGEFLEKYYRENGGDIIVFKKENVGHHPHGLEDNTKIIEFIESK